MKNKKPPEGGSFIAKILDIEYSVWNASICYALSMVRKEKIPSGKRSKAERSKQIEEERYGGIQVSNGPLEAHRYSEYKRTEGSVGSEYIDYYAKTHEAGQLSAWEDTFVISNVDERDKVSWEFSRCIGFVAVGRDKVTHKNTAFMSHQSPSSFHKSSDIEHDRYEKRREQFKQDFTGRLQEFIERVDRDSIDMVVFGGARGDELSDHHHTLMKSLADLAESISGVHAREIDIPNRPPIDGGGSSWDPERDIEVHDAYFDTSKRRLYVGKYSKIIPKFAGDGRT